MKEEYRAILAGFFMVLVVIFIGSMFFLSISSEEKQTCFESNKTYFSYMGVEYCGDISQLNNLLVKIIEFKEIQDNKIQSFYK